MLSVLRHFVESKVPTSWPIAVVKGNFVSDVTKAKLDWDAGVTGITDHITLNGAALDLTDSTDAGAIDELMGLQVGGLIQLDLFDSVLAYGSFELTSSIQDVTDSNGVLIRGAQVMTLSVTNVHVFAGVGGTFLDAADVVIPTGTVGTKADGFGTDGTGFVASNANLDRGRSPKTSGARWLR